MDEILLILFFTFQDQDHQHVDVLARKRIKEATDLLDEASKKSSSFGIKKARLAEQKIVNNKENAGTQ